MSYAEEYQKKLNKYEENTVKKMKKDDVCYFNGLKEEKPD